MVQAPSENKQNVPNYTAEMGVISCLFMRYLGLVLLQTTHQLYMIYKSDNKLCFVCVTYINIAITNKASITESGSLNILECLAGLTALVTPIKQCFAWSSFANCEWMIKWTKLCLGLRWEWYLACYTHSVCGKRRSRYNNVIDMDDFASITW